MTPKEEQKCCAICYDDDENAPPCCNKNCPCHSQTSTAFSAATNTLSKAAEVIASYLEETTTSTEGEKKYIKISPEMFKDLKFEVSVPTFTCACGETVLDTPTHRIQSLSQEKPPIQSWEERFDNKFYPLATKEEQIEILGSEYKTGHFWGRKETLEACRDFISTLIQEQKEELLRVIEGIGNEPIALDENGLPNTMEETECYQRGFRDAKEELKRTITGV